jgi:uncharacterized membrane protein SpoIIM required for sporulation
VSALRLKSYEFRRERQASWTELEGLVDVVEQRGMTALSADQLARLPSLYRHALSSLSVARSISLDRNVLDYLESLVGRAYFCVYGTRRHLRDALADFFGWRFPAMVRRFRWQILISALVTVGGVLVGFFLVLDDPERFYAFVSPEYAQGRVPSSTTEELKKVLYETETTAADKLTAFASFLFTHNAKIGILSFAIGFAAGLPVFYLMFLNGLVLGAFAALYHSRGLSLDFWGWILPHGITEISAVVLCGGAGLVLAQALIFPGRHSRLDNLGLKGRDAGVIALGAVVMFFVAGLIEGIFRQSVTNVAARYTVAITTLVVWGLYFTFQGRDKEPR